jgi:hypothetical protein
MDGFEPTLFAFAVGLTASGMVGSLFELTLGRKLAFAEPYISPAYLFRSLLATACLGPFMLANDALDARRERRISALALISCGCTAFAWALALGVAVLAIASSMVRLLDSGFSV